MASSSSSLAQSPFSQPRLIFEYDVFLTFNIGLQDREIDFLQKCLRDAGLKTSIADIVDDSALEMMEMSRIVVVLITPHFVRSGTCLGRLVKMISSNPKTVLPFFYGVSHGELRAGLQRLNMQQHRSVEVVLSSLYGFTLSDDFRDQEVVINHIANAISQVGLQSRVKEMLERLGRRRWQRKQNTIIVVIWGVAGIGKTTIARTIYDVIGDHFNCRSFLANIKDVWKNDNGQHLQKQLVSDILVKEGPYRKALIVLDDVNEVGQLIELCGKSEQFGKGSLIFITTRNKGLFDDFVDESYEVEKLGDHESLQLFIWHAFKKTTPTNDFVNLSRKVITLCDGLPLILELIGSLLHNKTKSEWKKVLKKLKNVPSGQIQHKIKISIDFLADSERKLFCDIACFHASRSKSDVTHLFKDSRFPVEMAMQVLMEHRLVKVVNDKIHVHDLLQEIGREITPNKSKFTYMYDVFLSFRGEDTRKSFVTHLYVALKQAGVKAFMDEEGIARGEHISDSLLLAIECSRISIIIFSKNYAGSGWCLQELEKVMECYKTTSQEVFPIFYDVQPSEVRKQQNSFGKVLQRLIMRPSSSKGKKLTSNLKRVLTEAANLSGWDMQNYRTEADLLDDVVKTITTTIDNSNYMFVAHHPVGLESRVQDIIKFLSSGSNETIIVGIWGMGGIGKTTLAKAIYNQMGRSFAGKSFLADIREVWKQDKGLVYLQEQLLSNIFKTRRINISNAGTGKSLIKEILGQKKVFIVLDDVNHEDQLKALCGSREWFAQGSRIIITSRDERLLQITQVDKVFNVREMDNNECIELFSWHAFKHVFPERNFIELSRRVVSYCRGLPLALEILGSYLFDREMHYWESTLNKLKQIPNDKIHEILRISFDGLSDQIEQELFLDICCFFIGKDRSYATQILDGCGLHAENGITHLIERSLVKVVKLGNKNILGMHDLLRDMGREIVREQSPKKLERRTRLWFKDDVLNVLENCIGTIAIEGLSLSMPINNSISLTTKAFSKMKRLRLLNLDHVQLKGDYCYLSKELRWLSWHSFPLENLPTDFNLEKIVAIDLRWSNLTKVWEKNQVLEWLKILNLSHSHCLLETPEFSSLPHLEKLILKDCPRLSMIHPSIGNLRHLIILNLKNCNDLEHLPKGVYDLTSLRTLNLSGCSKIERLDEDIEKMESLTTLVANETAITHAPYSIVRLKNIQYVSLCGHEGLSRDVFPSLILSWMHPTSQSKSLFQSFGIMPSLIRCLSHPLFAKSREILKAKPRRSQASCQKTPASIGFREQVHEERSKAFKSCITIHAGEFNEVIDSLLKSISQGCSEKGFGVNSLPGDNYPHWQNFKGEGSSVFFEVPQIIGKSLKGLILCIIYLSSQDMTSSVYPVGFLVSNHTKATIKLFQKDAAMTSNDEDNWQDMIYNLEPGNRVEVIVTFACELRVKNTLVYLVYDEDVSKRIMY